MLGITKETFGEGRVTLRFGNQKINLDQAAHEFEPKENEPLPGSKDLCFITETEFEEAIDAARFGDTKKTARSHYADQAVERKCFFKLCQAQQTK